MKFLVEAEIQRTGKSGDKQTKDSESRSPIVKLPLKP